MTELLVKLSQLIGDGLAQLTFGRLVVLLVIFFAVPIVVWFYFEREKISRAKDGMPKIGRRTLQVASALACALSSLFITVQVAGWPHDEAINYTVLSAVTSPVMIWAFHQWLKRRQPEAADEFGEDPLDETVVVPTDKREG